MDRSDFHDSFEDLVRRVASKEQDRQESIKNIRFNTINTISNIIGGITNYQGDAVDIRSAALLAELSWQFVKYASKFSSPRSAEKSGIYVDALKSIEEAIDYTRSLAAIVPAQTHAILGLGVTDISEDASWRDFALSVAGDVISIYKGGIRPDAESRRYLAMLACTIYLSKILADENPAEPLLAAAATFSLTLASVLVSMTTSFGYLQSPEARDLAVDTAEKLTGASSRTLAIVKAEEKDGKLW